METVMTTITSTQAVFAGTIQKTDEWLHELMRELQWDDPHRAYVALRATLHALRDRLTIQEGAQLAAQLPLLIRGVWFEGWKPRDRPVAIKHVDDFYAAVERELRRDAGISVAAVVRAVFKLLATHITEGEITDVVRNLPDELRTLWP
jgi:uncharacterized protein (DUF2267 family)